MIQIKHFGKHGNVLFAEFGKGDIKITKARNENDKHETMLMFYNQTPHVIGEEDNEFTGKSSDELDAPGFVMSFSKPESITALIHSLIELQKSVFEHVKQEPVINHSPVDLSGDDSKPSAPFQPFADAIKNMENPKDSHTVEGKFFKEGDRVYGTWVDYDGSTHYQQGVIIKNEVTGLWLDDGDGITEIKRFIFLNKQVSPVKPPHDPSWPTPFA